MVSADSPQTDRELLLQIASELRHLNAKITGKGGICDQQHELEDRVADQEKRVSALENWRWYLIGMGTIFIILVSYGRYLDLFGKP